MKDDDPPTPDEYDRYTCSARDSGVGFALALAREEDEEVKSASDLALDSARESVFHIISERDLT